jgi:hypothetical protein
MSTRNGDLLPAEYRQQGFCGWYMEKSSATAYHGVNWSCWTVVEFEKLRGQSQDSILEYSEIPFIPMTT